SRLGQENGCCRQRAVEKGRLGGWAVINGREGWLERAEKAVSGRRTAATASELSKKAVSSARR
uniref:hypothetical protein n=1 Tax=Paenibacillus chondroitinus TaxID=59842 RepID=UPI001C3FA3F9